MDTPLRNEIERMVRKGWLQNWVKQEHEPRPRSDRSPDRRDRPAEGKHGHSSAKPAPSRGTIHMIVGGPTDGDSNRGRRRSSSEEEISHAKTRMVTFLVVDSYSTYNVIIGRPPLNSFQAIVSTFHMKLKFVVGDGIGEVWGNARVARKCYVEAWVKEGERRKSKRKVIEMDKETKPIKIEKKRKEKDPDTFRVLGEEKLMMVELTRRSVKSGQDRN
ncbi:hypothetical protein DH2020_012219 [Rehmannia glutinosa]|uniref:Uncharacterized protein n=1 Tax=Rehmannia glutinosa TaxID=99300 RepID=A0ABR0X2L8_REHGL